MSTNHLKAAKNVSGKSIEDRLLVVVNGFLELAEALSLGDLRYAERHGLGSAANGEVVRTLARPNIT